MSNSGNAFRIFFKLLAGREPDVKAIGVLLSASLSYGECREAIDVLAERFRTGNMPAPFRDDLRRELINVVNKASLVPDFPNGDLCSVLLAYCGDRDGLDKTRKLAMRTSAGDVRMASFRVYADICGR